MSKKIKPRSLAASNSSGVNQPQQSTVAIFTSASYSGPLPPPEMLQKYNDVSPGLAERIVTMAEQQSAHRRELERKVVFGNERRAQIGQILAFAVAVSGMGAGVYLTMNNKPTEGLTAILGPLLGIVGVFVYGKIAQRKQLASKSREIARRP